MIMIDLCKQKYLSYAKKHSVSSPPPSQENRHGYEDDNHEEGAYDHTDHAPCR